MKKFVIMLLLPLLLSACGGSGETANKTSDLMKGSEEFDETKWSVDQYSDSEGDFLMCGIWSDNYYVINERDIALRFVYQYWPAAKRLPRQAPLSLTCSFALGDITPGDGTTGIKPSFATEGNDNKQLSFIWNDGRAFSISMNAVKPTVLTWFQPYSGRFLKDLNNQGAFTVSVMLKDGQILKFHFDTSKRDKVNVESME